MKYRIIFHTLNGIQEGFCRKFEVKGSSIVLFDAEFDGMTTDVLVVNNSYFQLFAAERS